MMIKKTLQHPGQNSNHSEEGPFEGDSEVSSLASFTETPFSGWQPVDMTALRSMIPFRPIGVCGLSSSSRSTPFLEKIAHATVPVHAILFETRVSVCVCVCVCVWGGS